jgi:hypothetical protein
VDRRTFLASGALAAGAGLAGCGRLGGTETLEPAERDTEEGDEAEAALVYRDDGDQVVVVGFEQRRAQDRPTDSSPFRLSVPHGDDTTVERFRFDLLGPTSPVDVPAEVYLLAPPNDSWPGLTVSKVDGDWTRIDYGDPGEIGEGTITVEGIVDPVDPITELRLRGEVELSTSGPGSRRYRIEPEIDLPLVTE